MQNKLAILISCALVLASLLGCSEKKNNEVLSEESKVGQPIHLKGITTGVKPGKEFDDGYLGHWSFFGHDRLTSYKLHNGLVYSFEASLGDSYEGSQLKDELEKKLTAENGRAIKFTCNSENSTLSFLKDMAVTNEDCRVEHDNQVLTIHRVFPRYAGASRDFPNLTVVYDHSTISLVDTKMVLESKAVDDDALKKKIKDNEAKAKADL